MKKIITGIAAMLLVSCMSAHAGEDGKKKAKKSARKTECCTKKPCCDDPSKCNSVSYVSTANTAEAMLSDKEKKSCCDQQSSCVKKD
jgi:hypothetical protein